MAATPDNLSRQRSLRSARAAFSVGCLAHELAQPLSGILLNASTCLRMLNSPEANAGAARAAAELILRDVHRCTRMIHALRALFSESEVELRAVALNDAIRDAVGLTADDLSIGRIELQLQFAQCLPPVLTEPVLLEQVLLNLIRNAIEAMSQLSADRRRLRISTHWDTGLNGAVVGVHDVGPGIPTSTASRLFTPFFTTKPEGMGLGLSLCRRFAERYGGKVWMTPNDPSGSTFWLYLPGAQAPASPQRPSSAAADAELPRCASSPWQAPALGPAGGKP